jgi:hypothetical protein
MDVLFFNDVLNAIIKQNFTHPSHKETVGAIMRNDKIDLIYSKKMLELLRDSLSEDDMSAYQSVVTMLADIGKNLPGSASSKSMENEVIHLNLASASNIVFNIAYGPPNVKGNPSLPRTAVIANMIKPNYDWLICNLAILYPNKVTVESWDVANNKQIEQLFKDIFSLPNKIDYVNIFDTQCNVGHAYFDSIINREKVGYYTKRSNTVGDEENYSKFKNKFLSKFKMFTIDRSRAHGRRILFGDVIVSIDNDFQNLKANSQDWFVDIQINKDVAAKLHNRRGLYIPFISSIRT